MITRAIRTAMLVALLASSATASAQDVLPFPAPPMGGKVGPTMQHSVHKWREQARHLPEDAPNILIVMLDDAGFGKLAAGKGKIALEMRTPLERAAPAEVKFWINGKEAAGGTVQRTIPLTFTASETFDKAPFKFEGTLKQLHFENLQEERPAYKRSPDDD